VSDGISLPGVPVANQTDAVNGQRYVRIVSDVSVYMPEVLEELLQQEL
jgi:hypothetical protein